MCDRSWLLELETLIARRMGQALMMKSLSIRSQMSTKTNSGIKMMLRIRMAIMRGVEMVLKRSIENMRGGGDGGPLVLQVTLTRLPVYFCTSIATSFPFYTPF